MVWNQRRERRSTFPRWLPTTVYCYSEASTAAARSRTAGGNDDNDDDDDDGETKTRFNIDVFVLLLMFLKILLSCQKHTVDLDDSSALCDIIAGCILHVGAIELGFKMASKKTKCERTYFYRLNINKVNSA